VRTHAHMRVLITCTYTHTTIFYTGRAVRSALPENNILNNSKQYSKQYSTQAVPCAALCQKTIF